jgi:hypothetical protein
MECVQRLLLCYGSRERKGEGEGVTSAGKNGKESRRKREPSVCAMDDERWRRLERGLPFIVRVWSGLLIGLGPFNRDGHFLPPL